MKTLLFQRVHQPEIQKPSKSAYKRMEPKIIPILLLLSTSAQAFQLRVMRLKMSSDRGAGMDGGSLGIRFFGGGDFEMEICSGSVRNFSTYILSTKEKQMCPVDKNKTGNFLEVSR